MFSFSFPTYFKLVDIDMVQVLGNMEDECCFNSFIIYKLKLHNQFINNLGLVVKMFSQFCFTLHKFPYVDVYE
jgi:hypothetical protein